MVDNGLSQFKVVVAESTNIQEAGKMAKLDFKNFCISSMNIDVLSLLFNGFRPSSQLQL